MEAEGERSATRPGRASSGVGRRALRGLVWLFAQNVVARATGLLSQLALAALLRPEDFGLIGLASSVTNVAQAITNVGVEDVLLQRNARLWLWSGPAFWIMLALSCLAAATVAVSAPFAAAAFGAPGLVGLLLVSALAMPISAFSTVPGAALRAELRFGFLASWGATETVAQAGLTVLLAWAGYGAYSFVIPVPVMAAARAIAWSLAARSAMRLDFRPKLRRWRHLVANSAMTFVTRLILALISQGDYIMLGLFASEAVVGRYYFGFRLAAQPLWMLAGNFSGVMLPALVQINNDPVRQAQVAVRASVLLSYCVMPLAFTQAAVARPLIERFFAERWEASIPVLQLLSIGLAFDAVSWIAGALLTARGEFRARLVNQLTQLPVFFALVSIGAYLDGAIGTAIGVCIHYLLTQPPFVYRVYRRTGISRGEIAAIYVKPTVLAGISVATGLALSALPSLDAAPLGRVLVTALASGASYALLVRWRKPSVWFELAQRARGAVGRN